VGEEITQVLNPAMSRSNVAGAAVDQLESALASRDIAGEQASYGTSVQPDNDRYGDMEIDREKGLICLDDAEYDSPRDIMAVAFESATDDGEQREGILAVDDNGASARVYSDGETVYNGVDEAVMNDISALARDIWGYLAFAEREAVDGAGLEDKPYTVEMEDDVEKQRAKLDGSKQELFDKTLVNLAEAPYDRARDVTDGGRSVYHAVSSDDRVLARVDDDADQVTVYWYGDHDDMDQYSGKIH